MTNSGARVLVVHDDAVIRSLLSVTLSDEGFTVNEATTGQQALDLLRSQCLEIVILDAVMPDMSGAEVAARLRHHDGSHRLKVLVLGDVGTCLDSDDVEAHLAKPFEPREFVEAVKKLAD